MAWIGLYAALAASPSKVLSHIYLVAALMAERRVSREPAVTFDNQRCCISGGRRTTLPPATLPGCEGQLAYNVLKNTLESNLALIFGWCVWCVLACVYGCMQKYLLCEPQSLSVPHVCANWCAHLGTAINS